MGANVNDAESVALTRSMRAAELRAERAAKQQKAFIDKVNASQKEASDQWLKGGSSSVAGGPAGAGGGPGMMGMMGGKLMGLAAGIGAYSKLYGYYTGQQERRESSAVALKGFEDQVTGLLSIGDNLKNIAGIKDQVL
jgi:hypothetical protein